MNNKETAFVEYSQLRALTNRANGNKSATDAFALQLNPIDPKLNQQDIVNVILEPYSSSASNHLAIINQSVTLRKLFNETLDELAIYTSEQQIAADSISTSPHSNTSDFARMSRKGYGYELKFVPANPAHTDWFIILILDEPSVKQRQKGVCVHAKWQQGFSMIHLNHTTNGKFQTIINEDDQIYNACFDVSTHWFIV